MRPGPRIIHALLLGLAISLLIPWVPAVVWLLLIGALTCVALGGAEWVMLRRIQIEAERQPIVALSLDDEDEITLSLQASGSRPVRVTLRQLWPNLLRERSTTESGLCLPGQRLTITFNVHGVVRGTEPLDRPFVATTLFGFVERIRAVGEVAEISVLPNLHAVRRLHQQLNQFALRGLGSRSAPRLGKGREFDRLREYVMDDDFRDVAWKASARHGKLIVREFRLDRSQDILICLDRGHRMAARVGYITKVDYAVNAAVLLSYISNRMEDRVGMLSFGAEVEQGIGQGCGRSHLRQLTAFATSVKPEYIHTDYLALAAHLRRRIRRRTLVLILTDLPQADDRVDLVRAVGLLMPRHLPLVVILSDPELEAASQFRPADRKELCHTLVARDVWSGRQRTLRELRARGARVVDTAPNQTSIDSMNAYIDIKRRQLL